MQHIWINVQYQSKLLFPARGMICALAHRPNEFGRRAGVILREFYLQVGGFGKELCGGLSKESEMNADKDGAELVAFAFDLNEIVRLALIRPGIGIQEREREGEFLAPGRTKFPKPDVAEAHGIAVILQGDRLFYRMQAIGSAFEPTGGTGKLDVVLDENAIMEN